MFIKQIIIQGFKSYKDQTVIEPFSPHHNVIVGRNGSGKSNFFWAIRFVLSDAYSSMTREERQALLHEGQGPATLSAYVEMIFDNSDNRFPTGKEEVVLRRTIGLKKDEYSLDKKSVTKTDVMNLLESAGFSRSNPYYIVPQGRITALTNAKDPERLQLLKEVAGTKVYEQRRSESVKIMSETELKRQKIDELLKYIEERLAELDDEKEELRQFQELDRERRCLEYTMYSREQDQVNEAFEQLEDHRRVELEASVNESNQIELLEKELNDEEQKLVEQKQSLDEFKLEKTRLSAEIDSLLKQKAHVEVEFKDLSETCQENDELKVKLLRELEDARKEIQVKHQELDAIEPQYKQLMELESTVKTKKESNELEMNRLYSKQGRFAQFKSKKQRDEFLTNEIKESKALLKMQTVQSKSLEAEIESISEQIESLNQKATAQSCQKTSLESIEAQINKLKAEKSQFDEERKTVWRNEAKLLNQVSALKEECSRKERQVFCTVDRSVSHGLEAVSKIAARLGFQDKVHGPLYRLFKVDERYHSCVEAVAGSSLFHVVVDTDTVATGILDVMHKENLGRATFMPLNRLNPKKMVYPQGVQDAIPMIKKLQFDSKFSAAFEQVFGKSIICPSLEVASGYARSHGLNGVTLDGDRADKKGALTGGYAKKQRLDMIFSLNASIVKLDQMLVEHDGLKQQISTFEQKIVVLKDKIKQLEDEKMEYERIQDDSAAMTREFSVKIARLQETLESRQQSMNQLGSQLLNTRSQIEAFEEELKSPLSSKLTSQEQEKLEDLKIRVPKLQSEYNSVHEKRMQLQAKKDVLKIQLDDNLMKQEQQIEAKLKKTSAIGRRGLELGTKKQNLTRITSELEHLTDKLENLEAEEGSTASLMTQSEAQLEKLKLKISKAKHQMQTSIVKNEKYLSRKILFTRKKEELSDSIRELGVLPEEAFQKFTKMAQEQLLVNLSKAKESLKKLAHVNRKAFEQYTMFTKQREQLLERRQELDQSCASIEDLIKVLDQRKDEAIQRTFKQVAKSFGEIWEKLVPSGKGQLVMQRNSENSGIESYSGVSIKLSFTSKQPDTRMGQLSGGQKSLVALALIFAIQQCDPAPFYLFDEIDAALDAQYRRAVANMIKELSANAQFITTTFRGEMLENADKFYGVTFNAKVSRIQVITQEQANEFISTEQTQ